MNLACPPYPSLFMPAATVGTDQRIPDEIRCQGCGIPNGGQTCADCRDELRGIYRAVNWKTCPDCGALTDQSAQYHGDRCRCLDKTWIY